jgi:hypothetical protein
MGLHANAITTSDHQNCSVFRSRIRCFTSQILQRLNLVENEDDMILGATKGLAVVGTDEPNPASTPSFSAIKTFMFGGDSFQGLEDKVSNSPKTQESTSEKWWTS